MAKNQKPTGGNRSNSKKEMPTTFPFWARMKMDKRRTTLVIDEEEGYNKKTKKNEDLYVHREATHTAKKDYERVIPNPDRQDSRPMFLKRPRKLPKRMFESHNKNLDMPKHLQERYDKNNRKK